MSQHRKFSNWFVSLVVLCSMYVPLLIFQYKQSRFDVDSIQTMVSLVAAYPFLAVARFFPREFGPMFYYAAEFLGFIGAVWLARRGTIWFVIVTLGLTVFSLKNIQEMLRWG